MLLKLVKYLCQDTIWEKGAEHNKDDTCLATGATLNSSTSQRQNDGLTPDIRLSGIDDKE